MRHLFAAGGVVLALVVAGPRAQAQEATASETAEARRLFEEGVAALGEERWADALDRFERSYGLVPRASTMLNLANAQSHLGQLVEAIESYRRFLAQASGRHDAHRGDAERMIEELRARVAHVELSVPGLMPTDVVQLDGRPLPAAALEAPLPMSPGGHRLRLLRDGEEIGAVELTLVEGERREVELPLRAARPPVTAPVIEVEPEPAVPLSGDDTGIWVGLGIGAGALVAGLAIVLAIVLTAEEEPFVGNLGPGTVTF